MAKKRLINCEFLNASSFKVKLSNNAKLLYLFMFANADDRGFVDTTNEIVQSLEENDKVFKQEVNMALLGTDYTTALNELITNGLLYEFVDNHANKIHLIRHWYYHNKMLKGIWTNYRAFYDMVEIIDNEYVMKDNETLEKEKVAKRNNINNINKEVKLNEIKLSYDNITESVPTHEENSTDSNLFDEAFGKDNVEDGN